MNKGGAGGLRTSFGAITVGAGYDVELNGLSVLIVEDDADSRELFEAILTQCGASVRVAASGGDALAACEQSPPAVVVSDLGMPGMDGFELLRTLRTTPVCADVPVIAVTGFSEYAARVHDAGFSAFLTKPVDPAVLCERVGQHART